MGVKIYTISYITYYVYMFYYNSERQSEQNCRIKIVCHYYTYYLLMGNTYCYEDYIGPCLPNNKRRSLQIKLGKFLKNSQFREVCLRAIQTYYDEALELQKEEVLRNSIASFSHYESNSLNRVGVGQFQPQESICQLPSPMANMEGENKQRYLLKLIRQSYLFLDFSDCIDNRNSYDQLMRHELMRGQISQSHSSFVESTVVFAHLEEELRNFNQELICKLQNYVRFCRKVKHDFMPDRERFLSKLNLILQGQIIQKYLNKEFRKNTSNLSAMMEDIEEIVRILINTVQMMFNLRVDGQHLNLQDEMFNSVNIYTMITSILFESQEFANFITNKIKECFKHRFNHYKNEAPSSRSDFINDFIALNSKHRLPYAKYSNINIFHSTQKIIPKIFGKSVPLFKLKIVYEINQRIGKQLQQLYRVLSEEYKIEVNNVYTRETQLLAIKWLLKANGEAIDQICAHLLYTYYFVDRMHLMDRKGSCLTTFMQEVQRIIQWSCHK